MTTEQASAISPPLLHLIIQEYPIELGALSSTAVTNTADSDVASDVLDKEFHRIGGETFPAHPPYKDASMLCSSISHYP